MILSQIYIHIYNYNRHVVKLNKLCIETMYYVVYFYIWRKYV